MEDTGGDATNQATFFKGEPVETCREYDDRDERWRCPICSRDKTGIIRRTKSGRLKAFIVIHHDHFRDHAARVLMDAADKLDAKRRAFAYSTFRRTVDYLTAFPHVAICEECNHSEARAKKVVGAPSEFSFGPIVMRQIMKGGNFSAERALVFWDGGQEHLLEMRRYKLATFARTMPAMCPWHEPCPMSDGTDKWWELFSMLDGKDEAIPNPYRMARR